jgi:cell wall-associated NlpC family hydrolase
VMSFDKYVGLSFAVDGRGPFKFDCWGLVSAFLREQCGVTGLPSYLGVADVGGAISLAKASDEWTRVTLPRRGDVVVMLTPTGGGAVAPLHVGVMIDGKHVLHVDKHRTSECVSKDSPLVQGRIESYWRHKGVLS